MSAIFSSSIERAALVIAQGGVIVCPTEGVYGISCSLFDETAIKRVIQIKERDIQKGLIIVDHCLDTLNDYICLDNCDNECKELIKRMWPGPHTFIVKAKESFNSIALRSDHSVAVRITQFDTLAKVCKASNVPMISTSANISGNPATSDLSTLDPKLIERVDLILDLPCGNLSEPTSIYDTLTHTLVRKSSNWK